MITRSDASTARRAASSRRTLPWSGRVGARWMMTTRSVISAPLPALASRDRGAQVSARSPGRSRRRRHRPLSPCRDPRGWGRRRRVRRSRRSRPIPRRRTPTPTPTTTDSPTSRRRQVPLPPAADKRLRRLRGRASPVRAHSTAARSPPLPTTSSHFEVPPSPAAGPLCARVPSNALHLLRRANAEVQHPPDPHARASGGASRDVREVARLRGGARRVRGRCHPDGTTREDRTEGVGIFSGEAGSHRRAARFRGATAHQTRPPRDEGGKRRGRAGCGGER